MVIMNTQKHLQKLRKGLYQARCLHTYGVIRLTGKIRNWFPKIHLDDSWVSLEYVYKSPFFFCNLQEAENYISRLHNKIVKGEILPYNERVNQIHQMRKRRRQLLSVIPTHVAELFDNIHFEESKDPRHIKGSCSNGDITIHEKETKFILSIQLNKEQIEEDYFWKDLGDN